jgi:hypothetical protein
VYDFPVEIETSVDNEKLDALVRGVSAREEVTSLLGSPGWEADDASVWHYEKRRFFPGGWDIDLAWVTPHVVHIDSGAFIEDAQSRAWVEILKLRFDETDVLIAAETNQVPLLDCVESSECSFLIHRVDNVRPIDLAFIEYSNFDLIERDALLYQEGDSEPFSGIRSSFYESGGKAGEFLFEAGLRKSGDIWHEDGSLYKEMTYKAGVIDGVVTVWFPKSEGGGKSSLQRFKAGRRHGVSTYWDPYGRVMTQSCYEYGEPKYDKDAMECGLDD